MIDQAGRIKNLEENLAIIANGILSGLVEFEREEQWLR